MKFQIKNRCTGAVQYECELSAEIAGKSYGIQLGFAIKQAIASGSDLSGSDLSGSDLSGSDLSGSDLSGSDLSGSADWIPRVENIHQAIYEAASKPNALDMRNWHATNYCGTTHCRAGWVIALAGMPGRVLEGCYGTPAAASMIYAASDPKLEKIPDFYSSNEAALADMKRLAEVTATA